LFAFFGVALRCKICGLTHIALDALRWLDCNAAMFMKRLSPLAPTRWALAAALLSTASLVLAETTHYVPVPNSSKLRMDGTSTIHDWHADTDVIGGSLDLDANFPEGAGSATITPKVEVKIPVRSLKTSGGKRMDAVMQDHMKYPENKMIEYRVLELAPKGSGKFEAKGALTVAGVTKTNTMAVSIEKVDKTKLKVVGKIDLKMTDFGISPPAPDIGLGLIKTGDDVKLIFEWVTEPKAP
jgi:polyisoprenoid-binding protein YceI